MEHENCEQKLFPFKSPHFPTGCVEKRSRDNPMRLRKTNGCLPNVCVSPNPHRPRCKKVEPKMSQI